MLGGLLGQARSPRAEATAAVAVAESVSLAERPSARIRWAAASRTFHRVALNPDPEQPFGDLIEISIDTQRLTAWRNGAIVYRFKISTARPGYTTPTGRFKVLNKARRWWSRQWGVWMPDALRFHGSYFIHSLPYVSDPSKRLGGHRLGRPDSHGCVRVGLGDSLLLWEWASVGTPVWVH